MCRFRINEQKNSSLEVLVLINTETAHLMSGLGWQVGSDPEVQVATVVSNHLTSAVMKYFGDSGRYQHAANLFEKLLPREPEVASLLAKSYIGMCKFIWPSLHV